MSRSDWSVALVAAGAGLVAGLALVGVLVLLAGEYLLAAIGLVVVLAVIVLRETVTERYLARRQARIARFAATGGLGLALLVVLFGLRGMP